MKKVSLFALMGTVPLSACYEGTEPIDYGWVEGSVNGCCGTAHIEVALSALDAHSTLEQCRYGSPSFGRTCFIVAVEKQYRIELPARGYEVQPRYWCYSGGGQRSAAPRKLVSVEPLSTTRADFIDMKIKC